MVQNPKTEKSELGFYLITYEKMDTEDVMKCMKVMLKPEKAEAAQRRKDQGAKWRRTKR
jgi:hypothetical protein